MVTPIGIDTAPDAVDSQARSYLTGYLHGVIGALLQIPNASDDQIQAALASWMCNGSA